MKICSACTHRFIAEHWDCPRCGWTAPSIGNRIRVLAPAVEGAPGFEADFLHRLDEVERDHFWFQGRLALIAWVFERFFEDARTFLDVGAGTGYVAAELQRRRPSLRCTVAEAFVSGLQRAARRTSQLELVQADALRLPYEAEFDVVGAFDVIEHIDDDAAVLREMARAVRPGGGLVLTVPQHRFLWSPFDEHVRHRRRYSRVELSDKLRGAGCEIVFASSFVSLLLPAMLAARIFRRASPPDPLSEFHVSAVVNGIGRALMRTEYQLIRREVSLPLGGSLLVVARAVPPATSQ